MRTSKIFFGIGFLFLLFSSFIFVIQGEEEVLPRTATLEHSEISRNKKIPPRLSILPPGDNPKIGSDTAKVKMIVFIDYQCPFCKAFVKQQLPILKKEYIEKGFMQVVFRDYPLDYHKNALALATTGHVMYKNGEFESFLDGVWNLDPSIDSLELYKAFTISGVKSEEKNEIGKEIEESKFLAGVAGISATPTFIINNRMIEGMHRLGELRSLIDYSMHNSTSRNKPNGACGD